MFELLRGGDADPAVATIAAVLPRVAATPVFVIVLIVCPPFALALTSLVLVLFPLGRPVESEGLDESRRPVGFAKHRNGLCSDVNRDEREHSKTGSERLTQGVPLRVGDPALADAGLAQAERAARCAGCALEQPVEGTCPP